MDMTNTKERIERANARIDSKLRAAWARANHTATFTRYDGTKVVCETLDQWTSEVARYEKESGGYTPPA